jgi:D-glycero-alpha-D-manno-heptose-7-phosphate kinase
LEAIEAGLPGGKQDQYAAALGGFHRLEFEADLVRFEPLRLPAELAPWLERQIVVCYTGQSRVSGATIARVMGRYARRDPAVIRALEGLVEVAERMAESLAKGNPADVGRLLTLNWRHQQALDPEMRTPRMAELEAIMTEAGALGGKAAGAGAGGSMFFLIGGDAEAARRAARAIGVLVLPLQWDPEGVRTW